MENFKITHLHADVGYYNGALYFLVDNKLLQVRVGTPNFNDYGEWRMEDFYLSTKTYVPEDNKVDVLRPYDFDDIEINSDDLEFLTLATKINDMKMSDEERISFIDKYGIYDDNLVGRRLKGDKLMSIILEDSTTIKLNVKWYKQKNKTSFEKIFYPILDGFRKGFLKRTK